MRRFIRTILGRLPSRRRRFWRYVSPQRHGAGALVLALLVAAAYGYWYQTNDRKIRREAETYLSELTGARVRIAAADFRFFGGVQLQDVRLSIPKSRSRVPFFRAERVVLRHHPWHLLLHGHVDPIEIVCLKPVVTLEYSSGLDTSALREMLAQARRSKGQADARMPSIRVREGRLAVMDVDDRGMEAADSVPLEISMTPRGSDEYLIAFEETGPAGEQTMQGEIFIDLDTGQVTHATTILPLERLEKTLPLRYRQWAQRYGLTGEVHISRSGREGEENVLDAELMDVSMKLPVDEGGAELVGVVGKMIFDDQGITLQNVAGRIPQAGNARFEMSGRYEGYGPDASYTLAMTVEGLEITAIEDEQAETLGGTLEHIRQMYQPEGRMNVSVEFGRDEGGQTTYSGAVDPQGMSVTFKYFPYRLDGVRGRIAFQADRVALQDLTGRHGRGSATINAVVTNLRGKNVFQADVVATDVAMDDEFRAALPEDFEQVWQAINPRGRADMNVRVARMAADAEQTVDVHLLLDGEASIAYSGFPYRVEQLVGDVYISGRDVRIDSLRGARGPARCTIDGELKNLGTDRVRVDLTIDGQDLPLDDVLADAVGEAGRAALKELRPSGSASSFTAHVRKQPGRPLDYNVMATLDDVAINLEHLPYPVEQTHGVLTILPGQAILEEFQGRHGRTELHASGQIYYSQPEVGLDLKVRAVDMLLDEELRQALPPRLQETWTQLQPTGTADLEMTLRHNLPDIDETDYRFVLLARDMGITYQEFPYPLRGIHGSAVATPEKVVLENMTLKHGAMSGKLSGEIHLGEAFPSAELSLQANGVPIDENLLKAVPRELAPLGERFEPGGTCDVDFRKFNLRRQAQPPVDDGPATRGPLHWQVVGSATLREAAVNLGFGRKTVTGLATGTAGRDEQGLSVQADVNLDSVVVGNHRVTNLIGKLAKSPNSTLMRLDDLEAQAHGGRLAGFAEIALDTPLRYGINLTVDRLRLAELFPRGEGQDQDEKSRVLGLLDGSMELIDTVGQPEQRKAHGVLRISEARLYKLPVLLDLLTVITLTLPRDAAFTEGEFIYHLRGGRLIFEEIYLRGPQLSLVGSGTMDMGTQRLRLTFLSGPPGSLPRLSGLADEVLTGIFREIAEIEVTGTLSAPKTRTRTLGSIEDALRRLLGAGEEAP